MSARTTQAAGPTASLGRFSDIVRHAVDEARASRLGERIHSREASVWSSDPHVQASIADRLGWLGLAGAMRAHAGDLERFRDTLIGDGYTDAVLLGMGGSSLAPDVFARTFGAQPGALDLRVLDSTSPEAVRAVDEAVDPARTVFLVATKSGTTVETHALSRYFLDRTRARGVRAPEGHFVAITDAGSPLETEARRGGWREVFVNPGDVGGRYSALSLFGLVPAALLGLDVERLLADAARAERAGERFTAAIEFGVTLGALAQHGADKVTLVFPPAIASFGAWVEQLLAESTGKNGTGLVPIDGEPLGDVPGYGGDRVFVQLRVDTAPDPVADAEMDALTAAGFPVLRRMLSDALDLGGEFVRWEVATAAAGAVLGVNPFDEPNVTESKDTTRAALSDAARDGRLPQSAPVIAGRGVEVHADIDTAARLAAAIAEREDDRADPASWLRAFLAGCGAGDYVALLPFLRQTPARDAGFAAARAAVRDRFGLATTLGYGPRYLHSTGQLHKGGPATGAFVLITADDTSAAGDLAIPGEQYTFGLLRDAQAIGDLMVLRRRGRRALHLHCEGDADAAVAAVANAFMRTTALSDGPTQE